MFGFAYTYFQNQSEAAANAPEVGTVRADMPEAGELSAPDVLELPLLGEGSERAGRPQTELEAASSAAILEPPTISSSPERSEPAAMNGAPDIIIGTFPSADAETNAETDVADETAGTAGIDGVVIDGVTPDSAAVNSAAVNSAVTNSAEADTAGTEAGNPDPAPQTTTASDLPGTAAPYRFSLGELDGLGTLETDMGWVTITGELGTTPNERVFLVIQSLIQAPPTLYSQGELHPDETGAYAQRAKFGTLGTRYKTYLIATADAASADLFSSRGSSVGLPEGFRRASPETEVLVR